MNLTTDEVQAKLQEPFPAADIEWRMGRCGAKNGSPWAKALAYLTNRAIMDRLDAVVGCGNWKNEKPEAGPQGGLVMGLSLLINNGDHGLEWVTKWDGAENTQIESVKGGLSDAMKRAAVQWGIGRYLYNLEEGWCDCSTSKSGDMTRYQGAKEGKHPAFYWAPPKLPEWALPGAEKASAQAAPLPKAKPEGQKYAADDPTPIDAVIDMMGLCVSIPELDVLVKEHRSVIEDSGQKKRVSAEYSVRKGELGG